MDVSYKAAGIVRAGVCVVCQGAIAGEPGPIFECVHKSTCGRWLACDESTSVFLEKNQKKPQVIKPAAFFIAAAI
ncbi:hypothetical protein ACVWXR_000363 [Pseudomonas lurida]|jgi:hypothetical protein